MVSCETTEDLYQVRLIYFSKGDTQWLKEARAVAAKAVAAKVHPEEPPVIQDQEGIGLQPQGNHLVVDEATALRESNFLTKQDNIP